MDGEDGELTTAAHVEYEHLCEDLWGRANAACCNSMLCDLTKERRFDLECRGFQSKTVGMQLEMTKTEYAATVNAFLADSHVVG